MRSNKPLPAMLSRLCYATFLSCLLLYAAEIALRCRGLDLVIVCVSMLALAGMTVLAFSRQPRPQLNALLAAQWLAGLTWFAWFYPESPFARQQMIGIDLSDPAVVQSAATLHLLKAAAVYLLIALLSVLPPHSQATRESASSISQ